MDASRFGQPKDHVEACTLMVHSDLVGNRIRELRAASRLSQQAIADAAGVSKAYVSAIERGVKPGSVRVLSRIAGKLGVPLSELVTDVEGVDVTPRPALRTKLGVLSPIPGYRVFDVGLDADLPRLGLLAGEIGRAHV